MQDYSTTNPILSIVVQKPFKQQITLTVKPPIPCSKYRHFFGSPKSRGFRGFDYHIFLKCTNCYCFTVTVTQIAIALLLHYCFTVTVTQDNFLPVTALTIMVRYS